MLEGKGRMLVGLHLNHVVSRPQTLSALFEWFRRKPNAARDYISCHDKTSRSFLCRLPGNWLANAGGSTWHASKTLAGSSPVAEPSQGLSSLSSIVVASTEMPAANAGGTTCNLWVPGSNPGRALRGYDSSTG